MKMKNFVLLVAGFWLLAMVCRPPAAEARVDVGVNINLPLFTFQAAPELAVIPGTYVYYVPDVNEDIYFYHGYWYRSWNNSWHRSINYNGPWRFIGRRYVPGVFWRLPGDYRHGVIHERIHYNDLHRHWRRWESDRHWDRGHEGRGGRGDHRDHRDHRGR
jgi:hypothetical protein